MNPYELLVRWQKGGTLGVSYREQDEQGNISSPVSIAGLKAHTEKYEEIKALLPELITFLEKAQADEIASLKSQLEVKTQEASDKDARITELEAALATALEAL